MILYIKDGLKYTRSLLQVKNTLSKVAGYKIDTQISSPSINNGKHKKGEIKKHIPFTTFKIIIIKYHRYLIILFNLRK